MTTRRINFLVRLLAWLLRPVVREIERKYECCGACEDLHDRVTTLEECSLTSDELSTMRRTVLRPGPFVTRSEWIRFPTPPTQQPQQPKGMKLYPNILVRALATFLRPLVVECIARGAHVEGLQTYVGRRCARGEVRPTVVDKLRFPELGGSDVSAAEVRRQIYGIND